MVLYTCGTCSKIFDNKTKYNRHLEHICIFDNTYNNLINISSGQIHYIHQAIN
jgi:uncharacterized C2H2 Zn-finger protein